MTTKQERIQELRRRKKFYERKKGQADDLLQKTNAELQQLMSNQIMIT